MSFARRMQHIKPFHVMELLAKAQALERAGRDIVHMEVGEPDFPTPAPIVAAAQAQLTTGEIFYTSALGLPELRAAISRHYAEHYGCDVPMERIVITTGASAALIIALGACVDRDEEWLLPDPSYPCNANFVHLFEGKVRRIVTSPENGFQPSIADVENAWTARTRGLLLASPANPTGTLIPTATMRGLHHAVSRHGGTLMVDEIYHGLTYGRDAETACAISDDIYVINSFSKYFGMTGWRLGWLVVPPNDLREIEKLAQNLYIAPPTLAQHAALAAFTPECKTILEARRHIFAERRDVLIAGLEQLGFRIATPPDGAFYVYANIGTLAEDSHELAQALLEEAGVAATPGLDFGTHGAKCHMRFAYTTDTARLKEGLLRMATFFRK
ncbi:MAG TPA: pyridoxal phosphate-dependent aminotransferase [Rhodocyclaceae bacterium]|nr:pyridoxal phosphate-dependent aminotransferase [Rhodocyclaceae bacterium]